MHPKGSRPSRAGWGGAEGPAPGQAIPAPLRVLKYDHELDLAADLPCDESVIRRDVGFAAQIPGDVAQGISDPEEFRRVVAVGEWRQRLLDHLGRQFGDDRRPLPMQT